MLENSYMVIIPQDKKDISDPFAMVDRLKKSSEIKVLADKFEKNSGFDLKIKIGEDEYDVNLCPTVVEIPEGMIKAQHFFSDIDVEKLKRSGVGIGVSMKFSGDSQKSYHNQLKVIDTLVENKLAVLDGSSEKVLSGVWVALAAKASVSPAPRYIYTVQAVSKEENKDVWLHTHGLGRCGLSEIEILCSDAEMFNTHYSIIETMANRMLEMEEPLKPGEPMFLAWITEGFPFMATVVPWQDAIKLYPKNILGGESDREDPYHSDGNVCIMFFASPDDIENKVYTPINVLDRYLKDNPMYMFSSRETERMKQLAAERVNYMLKAFSEKRYQILVKIGLKVDAEFAEEDNANQREHIWFELTEANSNRIKAKLTQEPYYVKDIKVDDIREYGVDEIVDWIIFDENNRYTPDDVYQLTL